MSLAGYYPVLTDENYNLKADCSGVENQNENKNVPSLEFMFELLEQQISSMKTEEE